ncbi:MAG: molecular chaperone HtpG [Candidatus Cloacimonetes bacterium]|nr:molecular chaperone HtpG [Candidatus Cloacimonadota bacterium]MBS3768326.1 molecular chaperone HtpG [Candidatus Cloacimonadota bacterium]
MAKEKKEKKKGTLSIHSENIFPIIKKWLYSEHDIFLRELISNSVDAMQKRAAIESDIDKEQLKIEVKIDKTNNTIKVIDYGIGMDAEEVEKYINQIAFSGAEDFVEKYKDKQSDLIGHFGLGFYSAFMVAEKVTIDSLSYKEDADPVYWECDGKREFVIAEGERKKVGTTVTIHVNKDNKQFLDAQKIKDLIKKYSNFVPFPVYVNKEKEPVNLEEALWNKEPSQVEDKEYKEFYKKLFNQYEDPLFWIHLNVDFPFKLKGILYFPKIKRNLDINQGRVKLYCNNVFVADDLKQIIPEFLLLLRGGLDIPDIPLNVSRSFLQEDKQVRTVSKYIIKKVADSLKKKFKDDREEYQKLWEDINHFVKYGIVTEDKFYEAMKDNIIFKTPKDEYLTIEEYKTRNPSDEKMHKIYYAKSEDTQLSYLKMMEEQGIDVLIQSSVIDGHLFQKLEMQEGDVQFVRVDSEVNENLVNKDQDEIVDKDNKTPSDKIKEIVENALDNDKITVQTKSLKSKSIPGMVVFNEQIRRMQEMNNFTMMQDADLLANHTFVVNTENETVKKLLKLSETDKKNEISLLCNFIHDLAMLEQKQFTGKELQTFIKESNQLLNYIK